MKKKMIYLMVVLLLIIAQLIYEEFDVASNDLGIDSEIFIETVDEVEPIQDRKVVVNAVVEGCYDPILVKTDREINNEIFNKLCRLNRMDREWLMTLKGIGEVTADKILDYRARTGYFKNLEDLMKINGIGPKKYTSIEEQL